jgi:hypothetical protein
MDAITSQEISTTSVDPWSAEVRDMVLDVWGGQSCWRASDWPDARERLVARWGDLLDAAVTELAQQFGNGVPDDAPRIIWQAFPRLNHASCVELARRLIGARAR